MLADGKRYHPVVALSEAFARRADVDPAVVEERLAAGLAEASTRWPAIALAEDAYAAWVAARVPVAPDAAAVLDGLRLADLYLACTKARIQVTSQMRRALLRNKQIHGDELDSLVELVRSQPDLTADLRERR
jgi:hypothetical protein